MTDQSTDGNGRERGSAYCKCDNPTVVRTLAKGTPAEKQYCECGKRVDRRERYLNTNVGQSEDIEWQVEKRTLVQLSSIERMLRDDVASNEAIADAIQDCREELECAVNTGADQSEDGDQS